MIYRICFAGLVLSVVFAAASRGAEATDAVGALKGKYETEVKALQTAKDAALAQAKDRYLADLAAAERTSGAQGKVQEVAAIAKEKENVAKGPIAPAFPAQLPTALTRSRNDYLAAAARVHRDFSPRQQRLDADALRTVTSYEAKAKQDNDNATLEQIAAFKQRLLAQQPAPPAPSGASRKSALVNGDFSVADGDTPAGWKGDGKIARENRESFLRIEQNNPTGAAMITQQVSVPEKARHIRATAKVRLKNLRMDNEFGLKPCFVADCYDKNGQQLPAVFILHTPIRDCPWTPVKGETFDLPDGTTSVTLSICTLAKNSGTFDFDDITLELTR